MTKHGRILQIADIVSSKMAVEIGGLLRILSSIIHIKNYFPIYLSQLYRSFSTSNIST